MPKVKFVETRQIRRNNKTVQWRAGETYDYDKEMQPMIDIGHATVLADDAQDREPENAGQPETKHKSATPAEPKPPGEALTTQTPDPVRTPARTSK